MIFLSPFDCTSKLNTMSLPSVRWIKAFHFPLLKGGRGVQQIIREEIRIREIVFINFMPLVFLVKMMVPNLRLDTDNYVITMLSGMKINNVTKAYTLSKIPE